MPAWFNVYNASLPRVRNPQGKEDTEGLIASVGKLRELVGDEIGIRGVPAEQVVLGGFSQGAAVALASAATFDVKLGGFMALSGFCPIESHLKGALSTINLNTPIFQAHGTADQVISYQYGKDSFAFYKETLGFKNMTFNSYPSLEHSTSLNEIADVIKFLESIFTEPKYMKL